MRVGMLWYDGDRKKAVLKRIEEGSRHYLDKWERRPNACHVNPRDVIAHPELRVVPNRLIRPDHFWFGEEEED